MQRIQKGDLTTFGIMGTVFAWFLSFATWKSIGWALLHAFLGWAYVAYYVVRYVL